MSMCIEFLAAQEADASALTEIRVKSKGHWGYSQATLESWRPAMQVTRDYLRANLVRTIPLCQTSCRL